MSIKKVQGMNGATSRTVLGARTVFDGVVTAAADALRVDTQENTQTDIKALKSFSLENHAGYLTVHIIPQNDEATPEYTLDFYAALDPEGKGWNPSRVQRTTSADQGYSDTFFVAGAFRLAFHMQALSAAQPVRVVVIAS